MLKYLHGALLHLRGVVAHTSPRVYTHCPYPPGGAPFDPLGLSDDAAGFEWQRVAEIKHGRMAMAAMAGCFAQAVVTQEGPVANLRAFAADPTRNNVAEYLSL